MDDAAREEILKTAIGEALKNGGHVEARYPHHAIVVVQNKKKSSTAALIINWIMTLVTAGIWGIFWLVARSAKRQPVRYRISVDLDGRVMQVKYDPNASDTLVR